MKATMCFEEFECRVKSTTPDNFSPKCLRLLYDHIEETEGQDWLFDIGKIRSEYREASFDDFASYYDVEPDREAIESIAQERIYIVGFPSDNTVLYGSWGGTF